jgi:hypothetical protein
MVFFFAVAPTSAQPVLRGLYWPGMNATNSAVLPDAGLTYQSFFGLESFDELKGPGGQDLPVDGTASVLVQMNIFIAVSKYKLFGGTYAAIAIIPFLSSSVTSITFGSVAGGAGFADSYFQPFTLQWQTKRADLQVGYGFWPITGRFNAGATNNVGAGYGGSFVTGAQTVYLTANKALALSAMEGYEFHTTQRTTHVHPGQTFDIDYSLTQNVPLDKDEHTVIQFGLVGYGQYQMTDQTEPNPNTIVPTSDRYRVTALGPGANVLLPNRKVVVGIKYFKEFANVSTVQGHQLQISATVTF